MTVQPPNHTAVSGPSLRLTSAQWRSGPEMKRDLRRSVQLLRSALTVSEAQELGLMHLCQVRLNNYRHGRDRQNKERSGRKSRAKSVCVCWNRLNGSVQDFKSTQSPREGFHWPQITSTYSQPQTSSGTVELTTSTVLIINNTVCPVLTEEGHPEKAFLQLVLGGISSSWSA